MVAQIKYEICAKVKASGDKELSMAKQNIIVREQLAHNNSFLKTLVHDNAVIKCSLNQTAYTAEEIAFFELEVDNTKRIHDIKKVTLELV